MEKILVTGNLTFYSMTMYFFPHLVDNVLNVYMCANKCIVYVYSKICISYLYIREKLRKTVLTNPKIMT